MTNIDKAFPTEEEQNLATLRERYHQLKNRRDIIKDALETTIFLRTEFNPKFNIQLYEELVTIEAKTENNINIILTKMDEIVLAMQEVS
ncbi:MAG: hypothetical protein LBU14_03640 [Candidatus Peribacteria bacterium]|jgi:putative ribosome biogenesis GTPase RsgA|nr:hypothetical protein [Candidatus Peribacteria bacterium]